jgi:hypothetical protein
MDERVVDAALGAVAGATGLAVGLARPFLAGTGSLLAACARTARGSPPDRWVTAMAVRGEQVRAGLDHAVGELCRRLLLRAVEAALGVLDLTELARRHLDLDALAIGIDIDAVVSRADLDAVMSRVDLDAVVSRVNLDGAVARVDLDAVVARVDLDAVVARVDLDAVASRIDLDAIAKRVDPDVVIARVDVDAALARLDLAAIARQVIDAVDLPEILRQSTGTVASEAVRGVRAEGMNADEAVARFVGRLLRRPRADRPVLP